jgi:hypothetical protein
MTQLGHGPLFWVAPEGTLKELFDALLTDIEEAIAPVCLHEVDFVR